MMSKGSYVQGDTTVLIESIRSSSYKYTVFELKLYGLRKYTILKIEWKYTILKIEWKYTVLLRKVDGLSAETIPSAKVYRPGTDS